MGEHSKEPVTWGAMMAREDDDPRGRMIGYQGFRAVRGATKVDFVRTLIGPVCDTYQEANIHAQTARLKEEGAP